MPRRNKYNSRTVYLFGHKFQSKVEAERYLELRAMQEAGSISDLEVHPRFELIPKFTHAGGTERATHYTADSQYKDVPTGLTVVEDVKSPATKTQAFGLRRKLLLWLHPEIVFLTIERGGN